MGKLWDMKKTLYIIIFTTWTNVSFAQADSIHCTPNPFVTNPTLTYFIGTADTLTTTVVNSLGQIVGHAFTDSIIGVGTFTLTLNTSSYPAGIYFVALKNHHTNLCTRKIIKNSATGIALFKNPTDLKVFPNPTNGVINIQTTQTFDVLKIYSVDNVLLKEIINPPTSISVADLPAGTYLLTGVKQNKLIFSYKIICP